MEGPAAAGGCRVLGAQKLWIHSAPLCAEVRLRSMPLAFLSHTDKLVGVVWGPVSCRRLSWASPL